MSKYSNRGTMVRRGGKGDYGNLPPLQNVVGMIDRLVVAQPGKSNPDKDYAEIYLVHSVPELGLVAEFDENGAPLTKIKVMMPPPREGGEGRRDILGLTQKKAGGPAMGQGSLVVFEKAYFDRKENVLKARFSKGGPTAADQEAGLKNLYSNIFVCVLPERQIKQQDGTTFPRQEVMIADQLGSTLVSGDEELRAAIESVVAQTTIGTAGFQLHCRQLADEALSDQEKAAFAADPETRQSGFFTAKPKLVGEGEDRQLAMPPSKLQQFIAGVRQIFERHAMMGETPALLTSPAIRPYVRTIIERFRPSTMVLSQNEIHARAKIKTLGQL